MGNHGGGVRARRRRRVVRLAFAPVVSLVAVVSGAQQPALRVYGIEDGLKFSQVFAVFQDHRGFIWAGTAYGLSRYDGREFTTVGKAQGLPHDSVRAIAEDGAGSVWVLTEQGLGRVDALGGRLGAPIVVPLPACLAGELGRRVKAIASGGGSLWLMMRDGVARWRGGRLDDFPLPAALRDRDGLFFGPVGADGAWVGSPHAVARVGTGVAPLVLAVPAGADAVALVRRGGDLLLLQAEAISRLAGEHWQAQRQWELPRGVNPTGMLAFGDGLLVITPARGVFRLERGAKPDEITTGEGLPSNAVYGAVVDRDGVLWLATADGLVKVYDLSVRSFATRRPQIGEMVLAFARDARGGVWVGHSEGVTLVRGRTLQFFDTRRSPSEEAGVWALLPLARGGVLAGTRRGLVLVRAGRIASFPTLSLAGSERVYDLARDAAGWIWASTPSGVVRFRWDDERERPTSPRAFTEVDGAPFGEARGVTPAADGEVWIGTDGAGVVLWDGEAMHRIGAASGLPSGVCRAVLLRPEGVWVATDTGVWVLVGGRATPLEDVNRALTDRWIVALAVGEGGAVWIATSYEVVKVVGGRIVARIDKDSGLIGTSTTAENCLLAMPNGTLLVGMVGGFSIVPEDLEKRRWPAPATLLLGAEDRRGRRVDPGTEVAYRANTVTFSFASPTFLAERRTRFQERLVGFDAAWSEPHPYPFQRYTNLPAGAYEFQVRAVGIDGTVSPSPARLGFVVATPWWQALPARVGGVLALVLLGWGVALVRMRAVRRRNEELEAVVRERTTQLAEANRALERLATTDGLTGIANHRVFQEELRREWARAERTGAPLALLMLDIDAFKPFNDTLGHQAGDECLRRVAKAVSSCAQRPGDIAARYGGEEFVLLLPGIGETSAALVAERVRAAVGALAITHPASPVAATVTVSVGFAVARPTAGANAASLIGAADAALYDAKRAGRNRVAGGAARG
jgi:diguanylate cyclase (GGDEF)-like protein